MAKGDTKPEHTAFTGDMGIRNIHKPHNKIMAKGSYEKKKKELANKGPMPKKDWRKSKGVHKSSLNFDYPEANSQRGTDYRGHK